MPIPVADEHVDEAGAQVVARIDLVLRARLEPDEDVQRALEIVDAHLASLVPLFQQAEHACERLAELAQLRVVRHHRQLRVGMHHAGGVEQWIDHERPSGVDGAGQVLEDVAEDRRSRIGVQQARHVLVDGAEHPGMTVAALQPEVPRLQTSAASLRAEPSIEGVEVEHGHLHGRDPHVSPLLAEQQSGEPARAVPGSGRDDLDASLAGRSRIRRAR